MIEEREVTRYVPAGVNPNDGARFYYKDVIPPTNSTGELCIGKKSIENQEGSHQTSGTLINFGSETSSEMDTLPFAASQVSNCLSELPDDISLIERMTSLKDPEKLETTEQKKRPTNEVITSDYETQSNASPDDFAQRQLTEDVNPVTSLSKASVQSAPSTVALHHVVYSAPSTDSGGKIESFISLFFVHFYVSVYSQQKIMTKLFWKRLTVFNNSKFEYFLISLMFIFSKDTFSHGFNTLTYFQSKWVLYFFTLA